MDLIYFFKLKKKFNYSPCKAKFPILSNKVRLKKGFKEHE